MALDINAIQRFSLKELSSLVDALAEIRHFPDISDTMKQDIDTITDEFQHRQQMEADQAASERATHP